MQGMNHAWAGYEVDQVLAPFSTELDYASIRKVKN